MTKTEIQAALQDGAILNDLLPFGPGQDCEIFKAAEFSEGDDVIYIPDVSLNEIPLDRPITDPEELDSVLGYCYTEGLPGGVQRRPGAGRAPVLVLRLAEPVIGGGRDRRRGG